MFSETYFSQPTSKGLMQFHHKSIKFNNY